MSIEKICPYCKAEIGTSKLVKCSLCLTEHHEACWLTIGRCSVFGCGGNLTLREKEQQKLTTILIRIGIILALALMLYSMLYKPDSRNYAAGALFCGLLAYIYILAYINPKRNFLTKLIADHYQADIDVKLRGIGFAIIAGFGFIIAVIMLFMK